MVRFGFPLNDAASLVFVVVLVVALRRPTRFALPVIFAAVAFQAASLATLIATCVGTILGWIEPSWTAGAEQTRAVEIAAITALVALAALSHRYPSRGHSEADDLHHHEAGDRSTTPVATPVPVPG